MLEIGVYAHGEKVLVQGAKISGQRENPVDSRGWKHRQYGGRVGNERRR